MAEASPLMEQYKRIKAEYRDEILFFRLGDFYEMFYQDAIEVSSLLNLTLTKRNGEPMCGIPFHSSKSYISRLLKVGKKIALCEQLTPPGKGIIERKVVEVITPGTVLDDDFLSNQTNNYIAAVSRYKDYLSWSFLDISTGEFVASSSPYNDRKEWFCREFLRISPRELIIQQTLLDDEIFSGTLIESDCFINKYPDWMFSFEIAKEKISQLFGVITMKGFGFQENDPAIISAGAILDYIEKTSKTKLTHIKKISCYNDKDSVQIDESSLRNLEIVANLHDGTEKYSLFDSINMTSTAIGARLLKKRLLFPSRSINEITERLEIADIFYKNQKLLPAFQDILKHIQDMERLVSRVATEKANARDLLGLAESTKGLIKLDDILNSISNLPSRIVPSSNLISLLRSFTELINGSIEVMPSAVLNEGNIIRTGYSQELDKLRDLKNNSRDVLENYIQNERSGSGINGLKLKYNRILGYFLEVTKIASNQVPPHFIRRQSVINAERFTTERLSELETEIFSSDERIIELEKQLFLEIRNKTKEYIDTFLESSRIISEIDIGTSTALVSSLRAYSKPCINEMGNLELIESRHPVVEINLSANDFIPNDLILDNQGVCFALITGPNMAGKSTFLRQTALIVLLAHAGYFVPAHKAIIGITDRIFCRVGAQDNLARGESTFLVEMNETASILNRATEKSLVIMDEVGRGTGTIDGLSIAWSVLEYILSDIQCRTLFATHFHELTSIIHRKMKNLSLSTINDGKNIIFLKKVIDGPAESSYGIHVAGLAGIPKTVLSRAREIESILSQREHELPGIHSVPKRIRQTELFTPEEILISDISSIDTDAITPLEALSRIAQWKKQISS